MSNKDEVDAGRGNADPLLLFLIDLAANGDLEIEISLQVRGALVTGRIVPLREYARRFAEDFANSFGLPTHVAEGIRNDMRLVFGLDDGQLEDVAREANAAKYIHLKDATVLGTVEPAREAGLWRGHLKDVDGFWVHGASVVAGRPRRVRKDTQRH